MAFPSVNVSALDMLNTYIVNAAQTNQTPVALNGSLWTAGGSGSQAGAGVSNTNNAYGLHE